MLLFARIGMPLITTHATSAVSPTVSLPSSTFQPYQYVTVTAQGFTPGETVYVYVVSFKNEPGTNLPCDTTGKCTGQLSLYNIDLAYGLHTLIARGLTSSSQAQTTFTLITGVTVRPTEGAVGTALEVDGDAFTANETVNIYWGHPSTATFVGSTTCDSSGAFRFTYKANGTPFTASGAPGVHQITIVRQNQTPTIFTTPFHLLPPKITVATNIKFGEYKSMVIAGFGINEMVTLSWNANGGQILRTLRTTNTGEVLTNFAYPPTPPGTYILTAKGNTSGLTATHTVHTETGIAITNAFFAFPGQTLALNGGGFIPGQIVHVYFHTTRNGVLTVTTDTKGSFSVSLTLPSVYDPKVSYAIHAVSADGTQRAEAPLSFQPPKLVNEVPKPSFGLTTQVRGNYFAVNETVAIVWDYGYPDQLQIGTATVDTSDHFVASVIVPSAPYGSTVTLAAVGQTSHLVATQTLNFSPSLLFPTTIPAGSTAQLQGGGFGANEAVSVKYKFYDGTSTTVTTVQTDARGAFSTSIITPVSAVNQAINVIATGNTSNASVMTYFYNVATLQITPDTGASGTTVTISGQGYLPDTTVTVTWLDPNTYQTTALLNVAVDSNGQFTQTVAVPSGLVSGTNYTVEAPAADGKNVQATFTAQ